MGMLLRLRSNLQVKKVRVSRYLLNDQNTQNITHQQMQVKWSSNRKTVYAFLLVSFTMHLKLQLF